MRDRRPFSLGLFLPTRERDYNQVESALWIRALQMERFYRALGIQVTVNNPFRKVDIAIYFRGMRSKDLWRIRFLKLISRRVYWDTVVNYYEPHEACTPKQVATAKKITRSVDGVIASTAAIAEAARPHNSNVFVMPDPIDLDHFHYRKKDIHFDSPEFSWSGISHKASFLDRYKDKIDGKITLITEKPVQANFKYRYEKWNYATFPEISSQADIAFLPRNLESSYNLGHSAFKALPYAVAGIPTLANRIPSYVEMAQTYDAITFLEDHPDFESALSALKTRDRNPDRVREAYSCAHWAKKMADFFSEQLA